MNIPDGWLGYTPWCIGDHDRSQFCNQWDEIDEIGGSFHGSHESQEISLTKLVFNGKRS